MGCDIHLYVEKKVKGKWVKQSGFVSDYYDPKSEYFGKEEFKSTDTPWSGRNYRLFSVLADVRNGRGFAGIDTGNAIEPISKPKGLPVDVSPEVRSVSEDWGCDGHSHSYLTLSELKGYAWDKKMVNRGYVSLEGYRELKKEAKPNCWCGDVGGQNVVKISPDMASDIKSGPTVKSYYVRMEWEDSIKDYCRHFIEFMFPLLEKVANGKPDHVRIVFWFDN